MILLEAFNQEVHSESVNFKFAGIIKFYSI